MKAIFLILLAGAIFGGAYYFAWKLYLKPQQELREEQAQPPPPPPPDPTLPEFDRCVSVEETSGLLDARAAWADFIDRFPESSRMSEAKDRLGRMNATIFLTPVQTPEKQLYVVKPGDVITKVAARAKTTPELLMKANNMQGSMLRIGQRLLITPVEFSLVIHRKNSRVTALLSGKFFKQYTILTRPAHAAPTAKKGASAPKLPRIVGKVNEKVAWRNAVRVTYAEKEFSEADHWIVVAPSGHSLYTERPVEPGAAPLQKPPGGGYGLAPEDMRELAALLRKNDPVTIE